VTSVSTLTWAKVFYSQKGAVKLAFPDEQVDRVEKSISILSPEQLHRAEKLARSKLESKIVKFYIGWKDDRPTGYAFIDVHTVRTKAEAFMVVLDPNGVVRSLHVLAFHEPLEYLPVERWFEQFRGKDRDDSLRPGRDIHAVSGATLSTHAASDGVRRVLALFSILYGERTAEEPDADGARGEPATE
jgi:Na+-translocating ferredoxin:NAD+ oxidoreductase RnfG subunit